MKNIFVLESPFRTSNSPRSGSRTTWHNVAPARGLQRVRRQAVHRCFRSECRNALPVVLGAAKMQGTLSELARFELPDAKNVAGVAHQIAARVKDHTIQEETS
jgi:hypothetical protein